MPSRDVAPAASSPFTSDDQQAQHARIDKLVKDTLDAHWARKDIETEQQDRRTYRHRPK